MRKPFHIWLYCITILGLSWFMIMYNPIHIEPSAWSFITEKQINVIDSAQLLAQTDENNASDAITLKPKKVDSIPDKMVDHLTYSHHFFELLYKSYQQFSRAAKDTASIRVLHMGDSQLEGDRITAAIRESFQKRFGGGGPGLVTVYDKDHINPSVWIDNEGNWDLHTIYEKPLRLENKSYGIMGTVAIVPANKKASFKLKPSPWALSHSRNYQRIRLFFAPHSANIKVNGSISSVNVINEDLPASEGITEINWEFSQLSPSLKLNFESKVDVNILACALDSTCGVAVDNISLRAQSTPLLNRTNMELYKTMSEHFHVGLIILQFGTNMVPSEAKSYKFYERILNRHFIKIRRVFPNIPVIVVGIADAADVEDGNIRPYANIEKLRDAQKAAALKNGFAFYDLLEAMGGVGSMSQWVNNNPPMAINDYVHFTRIGGNKAGDLMMKPVWKLFDDCDLIDQPLSDHPFDNKQIWNR